MGARTKPGISNTARKPPASFYDLVCRAASSTASAFHDGRFQNKPLDAYVQKPVCRNVLAYNYDFCRQTVGIKFVLHTHANKIHSLPRHFVQGNRGLRHIDPVIVAPLARTAGACSADNRACRHIDAPQT